MGRPQGGFLLALRMNSWLYWKVAFPVTPSRAIRDALAKRVEQEALRVSLILETALLFATNLRKHRVRSYKNTNITHCTDLTLFAC